MLKVFDFRHEINIFLKRNKFGIKFFDVSYKFYIDGLESLNLYKNKVATSHNKPNKLNERLCFVCFDNNKLIKSLFVHFLFILQMFNDSKTSY